ncbi:ABC transporter permease [Kitasatospora sp. KL5]|uniref:ABC transporter permease n=1 Tax=Kitasatospora sp. KL5 TaxID=3425125 RepID=UPI003D6DE0F3
MRRSGRRVRLLRIGLRAGLAAEAGRIRFAAVCTATLVLSLALAALVAMHAVYEGGAAREVARSPLPAAAPESAAFLWQPASDSVAGRQITLFQVVPLRADAPVPPGLSRWPGPGEVFLSPGLLAAGRTEGITTRYGKWAGTVGPSGLAGPGEKLAYVRPAADRIDREHALAAGGFGDRFASAAGDGQRAAPEWMFTAMVCGLLLLPAAVLVLLAVRIGARGRDDRAALVEVLGGGRGDRALIALGEAAPAVLAGAVLAAAVVSAAAAADTTVPLVGFRLPAADLRADRVGLAAAVAAAAVLVPGAAVLTAGGRPAGGRAGARRVRPLALPADPGRRAVLCPVMLLVAVRGPDLLTLGTSPYLLVNWAGVAGVLLTLPAAVAVAAGAWGRGLARLGRRFGRPALVVAGSRAAAHPAAVARLVSGVVVAVCLLVQAVVWYGQFGEAARAAQATRDRLGDSALVVAGASGITAEQLAEIVRRGGGRVAAVALVGRPEQHEFWLQGDCPALRTLRLDCPPPGTEAPVGRHPTDPRVAELVAWYGEGGARPTARRGSAAGSAGPGTSSRLVLVSTDGRDLSVPAFKQAAFQVLPGGASVDAIGGDWLAAARVNADHGRWIVLFGLAGVLVVAFASGTAGLAEFVRTGRALGTLGVLTGSRTVHAGTAALGVFLPIAAAGLAGEFTGVWMALPTGRGGATGPLDRALLPCAAAVAVVAACLALWGFAVAVREGRRWRPVGD